LVELIEKKVIISEQPYEPAALVGAGVESFGAGYAERSIRENILTLLCYNVMIHSEGGGDS
jgi:hypothetical protein